MRESMQVTIATPACATPSKPDSVKVSANLRLAASRSLKESAVPGLGAGLFDEVTAVTLSPHAMDLLEASLPRRVNTAAAWPWDTP